MWCREFKVIESFDPNNASLLPSLISSSRFTQAQKDIHNDIVIPARDDQAGDLSPRKW